MLPPGLPSPPPTTPYTAHSARPANPAIGAANPAATPAGGALAHLLVGHLIPDGETVLLLIKPTWWMLVFYTFRTALICGIAAVAATLYADRSPISPSTVYQAAVMVVFLRLLWALAVWMSRFYVLTDRRVMLLAGVFRISVADVPLLDIARTRLLQMLHDKPLLTGTLEIIPKDEQTPILFWHHVARARYVQAQIVAAIHRARQNARN